nr:MAG TPA: putative integral membrane protein [Microviridae sp.]
MSKFLSLLKSKKFWTLVAAIVAALTAFFTASCQYV